MFKHLVAALDGSESSMRALDVAIDLAARAGAALDIVSVEEEPAKYVATREEAVDEHSAAAIYYRRLHEEAVARAERRGLAPRTAILRGHEVQALVDYACKDSCDLIVVGYRGHSGVWGAFLGSTADKLVGHAPCSVFVMRQQATGKAFKRICLGLDGSPLGQKAWQAALELAQMWSASIRAVSVVENSSVEQSGKDRAWSVFFEKVQAVARAEALVAGVSFEAVTREGHAASAIIGQAKREDCDLIVIGATGHQRPWSPTAGGTARRVANEAGCAVLVVRPPLLVRRVGDVMTGEVATVSPEATTAEVVELLVQRGVKAVPVVDERRRVIGIITGGDLLRRGHLGLRLSIQRDLTPDELADQVRALASSGQRAGDVMTPKPLTIDREASLDEAVSSMVSHGIKRLPVTDREGQLVGIVSRTDILRHLAAAPAPPPEPHHTLPIWARTAGEAMDPRVPTVAPNTLAEVVLRQILSTPLRRVVVTDDAGKAMGIITDRDLLARASPSTRSGLLHALAGRKPLQQTDGAALGPIVAADLMKPHVFAVAADMPIIEAIRLMVTQRVKRLAVLDSEGRPIGIIDRQRLLQVLVQGHDLE